MDNPNEFHDDNYYAKKMENSLNNFTNINSNMNFNIFYFDLNARKSEEIDKRINGFNSNNYIPFSRSDPFNKRFNINNTIINNIQSVSINNIDDNLNNSNISSDSQTNLYKSNMKRQCCTIEPEFYKFHDCESLDDFSNVNLRKNEVLLRSNSETNNFKSNYDLGKYLAQLTEKIDDLTTSLGHN